LTVDEFVESNVPLELQPIVAMLRELMREMAPYATEEISYGYLCIKAGKYLPSSTRQRRILLSAFPLGGEFEDKFNLLRGKGKVSKHVKIKNLQSVNKDALRYYIRQALAYDEK
jgi:hypothetical protein